MAPLAQDIRNAREAVERVFDDLGVRAFAYTVERTEKGWTLSVDCATDGEWQTIAIAVDPAELNASLREEAVRAKLCQEWGPRLRACATPRTGPRTTAPGA